MALTPESCFCFLTTLPTKCLEKFRPLPETHHEPQITKEFIAGGKSGVVYGIGPDRVLKEYHDRDACAIEQQVYQRLQPHPNVAKLLEIRTDGSIVLERGTSLRIICRSSSANEIPTLTKVRWLRDAAEGYRHLHNCGIFHGDTGCHNWILTRNDRIKLIDFEGCSIDGGEAASCYEWFSYCPSTPRVSQRTDIFAFGCATYEVMTGRPPYDELKSSDNPYKQVEELYAKQKFPSVADIPLGQLIRRCWYGDVSSMSEVIRDLGSFRRKRGVFSWFIT